ncbi:DUF1963 domain-containing protein [Leptospira noguchii]|uniref:DUF1963 domain-containing protein n=1 Tax=Leptospira noguchii TaxID=28182 RepID=UPI0003286876|nr:DUF1963 domain-containing protein [Leptospira noguchii]EMS84711.1 PF09234 domain protein [Leptospira noguchii str. Cascata]UOG37215.1 DUF1963 domain-containing protein [Leptospira noguchii]
MTSESFFSNGIAFSEFTELLTLTKEPRFTKMGGKPYLPINYVWPTLNGKPLSFFAQIQFSELNNDLLNGNPIKKGLFYIFYAKKTVWGIDFIDREKVETIFLEDENIEVVETDFPAGLKIKKDDLIVGYFAFRKNNPYIDQMGIKISEFDVKNSNPISLSKILLKAYEWVRGKYRS